MNEIIISPESYCCSCKRCGRLHIWSIETARKKNYWYKCVECQENNKIMERDLM